MQGVTIVRESPVIKTARLLQLCGMFDLEDRTHSRETWQVSLDLPETWNVGLIVGPSGCGKSTVARTLWPDNIAPDWAWDDAKSVVDSFPASMKVREIAELLSSVGFSSPPSWLRPFRVLSTGEQFRVTMARTLAEMKDLTVVDEFTSVIDRTVAQIGSAAIAKTVRRRNQKMIAVTCHSDVAEWLCPDWIYEPATNRLARGSLQRPKIELTVKRVHSDAWQLFRKHHYLSENINTSGRCFVAFWRDRPVAFCSVLHFAHPRIANMKRGHRTVCLPDFQGVGIGNAMSDFIGSMCRGIGARYVSITSHPSMIAARTRSDKWRCTARPNATSKTLPNQTLNKDGAGKTNGLAMRMRATFEYVGTAMDATSARRLWSE
jgi:ABC-type lipoprotein export system ATPase subunit